MALASRLIKKYPNRRLYDTMACSYVTLADLEALVVGHQDFRVADARTGEDLTRGILLQIVLEEEQGELTRLPCDLLAQMIRTHGLLPGNAQLDAPGLPLLSPASSGAQAREQTRK